MLYLTIGLFALAAVMGVVLAVSIFRPAPSTPKSVVVAHGLFAASALVILIYYAVKNPDNYPLVSLVLFVVAALGGFILLFNDLKSKPGPRSLVVIHALAAVVAFVLLLAFALF